MKRIVLALTVTLTTAFSAYSASREETFVRSTYAKLAYSSQLRALKTAFLRELSVMNTSSSATAISELYALRQERVFSRVSAEDLVFEISEIRVGDLSEIQQLLYDTLVTKPGGDELSVVPAIWTYDYMGSLSESATSHVSWRPGRYVDEDWHVPFNTVFKTIPNRANLSRYATFQVSVTFRKISKTYSAMFLFGNNAAGKQVVLPIDNIVGGPALRYSISHSVYPATLLQPPYVTDRVVVSWLLANHKEPVANFLAIGGGVFCDPITLRCGIQSAAINDATSKYPSTNTSDSLKDTCSDHCHANGPFAFEAVDTKQHITGEHRFSAYHMGYCNYSNGLGNLCRSHCFANSTASIHEWGLVKYSAAACHVVIAEGKEGEGSGVGASVCNTLAVGAVKKCAFCLCDASFGFSWAGMSVSFPPNTVHNFEKPYDNSCPAYTLETRCNGPAPTCACGGRAFCGPNGWECPEQNCPDDPIVPPDSSCTPCKYKTCGTDSTCGYTKACGECSAGFDCTSGVCSRVVTTVCEPWDTPDCGCGYDPYCGTSGWECPPCGGVGVEIGWCDVIPWADGCSLPI